MWWSIFRSRSFLTPEAEASHFEGWGWLLRHFGGLPDLSRAALVLPTRTFFPPAEIPREKRAEHVFDCIKRHARMSHRPCRIIEQPARPERRVAEFTILQFHGSQPAGTFAFDADDAVVTYDPALLDKPFDLVATLAHELAHYKLAEIKEIPPTGAESLEALTDLTTVYLGFGLFGANSAFNFSQHQDPLSQGWKWSRLGYLSERDWVFAIAVFLTLRDEPAAELRAFLKPHLFGDLGKAMKYLKRNPAALSKLRAI